jgi:hypothetical protein
MLDETGQSSRLINVSGMFPVIFGRTLQSKSMMKLLRRDETRTLTPAAIFVDDWFIPLIDMFDLKRFSCNSWTI